MLNQEHFTDDDIERSLEVLGAWTGRSRLKAQDREHIRNLIAQAGLPCVPISGVAAIFRVSIPSARLYLRRGIIVPTDMYKEMHIFSVSAIRSQYLQFRSLRRQGKSVAEIGRMINAARLGDRTPVSA